MARWTASLSLALLLGLAACGAEGPTDAPVPAGTPEAGTSDPGGGPPAPGTGTPVGTPDGSLTPPAAGTGTPEATEKVGEVATQACPPLTVSPEQPEGFDSDVVRWSDGGCRPREAVMVRNTVQDPLERWGGYLRTFRYEVDGAVRSCTSSHPLYPGFGIVTSHYDGSPASLSSKFPGESTETLLTGPHHAVHAYRWTYPIDGAPVTVTVHWFFATGRDHPVYSVTYDLREAGADVVRADSRAPYGELDWDGGLGLPVDGLGWGDRYRFTTLEAPVSMASGWDYTEPNEVPFVREWSTAADAEMGTVQTQTWRQHDAGSMLFHSAWGTRDADGPMPEDWNWPFQLNQYQLPESNASKRLAWGTNFGAVGQRSYPVYGDDATASGWPFQSYSVHVVLGPHTADPVLAQVAQVEAAQATRLEATVGEVVTEGPAGVGRTDTVTYAPAGYDPVYGTWRLRAAAGAVDATFTAAGDALETPVFVIEDWPADAGTPEVRVADRVLGADQVFVTPDPEGRRLWVTLPGSFSGATRVSVRPAG